MMPKMIFVLLFVLVTSLTISQAYAAEVIFDSTKKSLTPGEIVELSGIIEKGIEGDLIALEVKSPSGEIILIRTVELGPGGTYNLKFKTPASAESGNYDIITNLELVGIEETQVSEDSQSPSSSGGGCLIATATYGSELAPQVQQLRELRDNTLLQTSSGSAFMDGFNSFYYSFSPTIADWERENPVLKETVKLVITPLLTSLSILNYVDMDSEAKVLGYGIGLIFLNIGMYFAVPALAIIHLKKKFHKHLIQTVKK